MITGTLGSRSTLNHAKNVPDEAPIPAPLKNSNKRVLWEVAPQKTNIDQAIPIPRTPNTVARIKPNKMRPTKFKGVRIFPISFVKRIIYSAILSIPTPKAITSDVVCTRTH